MLPVQRGVQIKHHPGSSVNEIEQEPDWEAGHQHDVGFKNQQDRIPGLTHGDNEVEEDAEFSSEAFKAYQNLDAKTEEVDIVGMDSSCSRTNYLSLRSAPKHTGEPVC